MSVIFFKKHFAKIVCIPIVAFVFLVCVYAVGVTRAKRVEIEAYYYFLALEEPKVEVGSEFAKWEGGAGYVLSAEGREYAVLAVYDSLETAERAQESLAKKEYDGQILRKGTQTLYFKGENKKNATFYTSALNTLGSYISVLGECIARLEKGMTQEGCKRTLGILQRQFVQAAKEYGAYVAFSELCRRSVEELTAICKGNVYAKDLRYIQCWQAEKRLELCSKFVL